jgi:glycosyltransferase involved in cell wall biosynthesis
MRLLVDIQAFQTPSSRVRGIGRYSRNLVAGIAAVRPGWHVELVRSAHLPAPEPHTLAGLPCLTFEPPLPFGPEQRAANDRYYADWLTARGADAVLICSFFESAGVVPDFTGPRPRLFGVLYDLIPLLYEEQYLTNPVVRAQYARNLRQALQADGLFAISRATAEDAVRILPPPHPPVVPVGGACDPGFAPLAEAELAPLGRRLRTRFGLGREFILYVGGCDHRKNMFGAMRAFAALPADARDGLDLVLACEVSDAERVIFEERACELGIADRVRLTGFVSDAELRALYQLCRVFFFPSLYEGLGLPVVEALHCGAPVVASDRSSVPEFAGPVSWLADPESPGDLARALQDALAEPRDARREERRRFARGFTWESVAGRVCRELERLPRHQPARRRRVAWVSPLPPSRSGIADYSADLLRNLDDALGLEVELVVDPQEKLVPADLVRRFPVVSSAEVPDRHRQCPYDLFVYHVGNSPFHVHMLQLLWRFRGLVVLHDYSLGHLMLHALHRGAWPATMRQELEREGRGDVAEHVEAHGLDWEYVNDSAPLNRRVLEAAEGVIVHSYASLRRVRERVDVPAARVPMAVAVPPLGSPAHERARLGLPLDAFLVCTLGLVGVPKRLPSLVRAVAALPPHVRARCVLAVVGDPNSEQEAAARALAGELGIGPGLLWPGRVAMDDLLAYARAADVCVQLRYPARGETSAALLRELAAGAVCVVSDQGSMAELPDDAVLKVRSPDHEVEDLAAVLTRLHDDPALRTALSQGAIRYMGAEHGMADAWHRYAAMIELTAARLAAADRPWLEHAVDDLAAGAGRAADEVIDAWAALRLAARSQARAERRPAPVAVVRKSA